MVLFCLFLKEQVSFVRVTFMLKICNLVSKKVTPNHPKMAINQASALKLV